MNRYISCPLLFALSATVSVFAGSHNPAAPVDPPSDSSRARELIRRLGSEDYYEREAAQAELAKLGRQARPALVEAATSDPDQEVRNRSVELLRSQALDYDPNLPGVAVFRRHAGTTVGAPGLFAEVMKSQANRDLFAAIEKGPAEGGRALGGHRRRAYEAMWRPSPDGRPGRSAHAALGDVAAILLAEIAVSSADIPDAMRCEWMQGTPVFRGQWQDGSQFMACPESLHAIAGHGPHAQAYRRIVAKWIATRATPAELYYLPEVLTFHLRGFEEALPALRRVVTTPGVAGSSKCGAMRTLVQYHGKSETATLTAALTDTTVVNLTADKCPCQVRDVALAFLLHLNGQDPGKYGLEYPDVYGPGRFVDPNFICHAGYAFRTEEKRAAAMAAFEEWRSRQGGK